MPQQKPKGLKSIPSQVQLPHGITLSAMPFKIIAYNPDGSPKMFELQPAKQPHDTTIDGNCVLFAQKEWIRAPNPGKAS